MTEMKVERMREGMRREPIHCSKWQVSADFHNEKYKIYQNPIISSPSLDVTRQTVT